jgi:MerR family redox-sensitive transcriptional activator SoxR
MLAQISVGELARRSGVAVSALHFYEAKGLILSVRTGGNQRRYDRDVLRRVAIIQFAQGLGLSLAEIGDALGTLPDGRPPNKADWERLSRSWHDLLSARIAKLERLRDGLTQCIGCGCLSTETCPLRNPEDRMAVDGPGPRILISDAG